MLGRFLKPIITKKNISDDEVNADTAEEQPLSPVARFFQTPGLNCSIIYVLGSNTIINVDAVKSGLNDSFVKHPRFSSLLVTDDKNGGKISWRRTNVDIHKHVYTVELDPNIESPATYVEDYISNLTDTGLDLAKPLWELHVLNVKTSDANATAVLKIHHSIGDGISMISLLIASSRKASDLESMPSLPKTKRPTNFWNNCHGFWGVIFTICTMIQMVFNTFVDVMHLAATALFLKDTDTPIKGVPGNVGLSRKRIVHRIVSLHDIELVKSSMKTTINDVLLGITMAGLSRYLNRKYAPVSYGNEEEQDTTSKKYNDLPANIHFRSALAFNIRPSPGISSLAEMMEKESKVKWGNRVAAVLIPITYTIALLDDPLDYVRKAKAVVDRKKLSFEAICFYSIGRFAQKIFGLQLAAAAFYKIASNTTMTFSNIVGPQEEISFHGHHLSYIAPSVYGHPQVRIYRETAVLEESLECPFPWALTVHWQSYAEKMIFVLAVDPSVIPDYNNLCADFESSLELIKDAVIQQSQVTVLVHANA